MNEHFDYEHIILFLLKKHEEELDNKLVYLSYFYTDLSLFLHSIIFFYVNLPFFSSVFYLHSLVFKLFLDDFLLRDNYETFLFLDLLRFVSRI
jgi:hypothetical protein